LKGAYIVDSLICIQGTCTYTKKVQLLLTDCKPSSCYSFPK